MCGKEFEAKAENHYVSRDNMKSGFATAISDNEVPLYDTFDCPHCGCQYVAQQRKRAVVESVTVEEEKEIEVEEEVEEDSKPRCFGNFEEEQSEYCDGRKVNEDCVREEYKGRMKPFKKPKCFGNYAGDDDDEDMKEECDSFCNFKSECKKEKEKANKRVQKTVKLPSKMAVTTMEYKKENENEQN